MENFLVVGGTGVMGAAAIQGVREKFGSQANIIANWYAKEDTGIQIEGADHTVFGDITDPACLKTLKDLGQNNFKYMFYATALGDVGYAIKDTTPEQIAHSNRLSFDPILAIENDFKIETIVGYSTFYATPHQLGSYGAMGYSKEAIEKWTFEKGNSQHACIRAGLFESPSSRGIKLLLRKTAKNLDNLKDPLIRAYFEGVTTKEGVEAYLNGIIEEEKKLFGDSPTQPENLFQAHLELFETDCPIIINVCGSKIWPSQEPQLIKDYI